VFAAKPTAQGPTYQPLILPGPYAALKVDEISSSFDSPTPNFTEDVFKIKFNSQQTHLYFFTIDETEDGKEKSIVVLSAQIEGDQFRLLKISKKGTEEFGIPSKDAPTFDVKNDKKYRAFAHQAVANCFPGMRTSYLKADTPDKKLSLSTG